MCADAALDVLRGMGVVGTEERMPAIKRGSLSFSNGGAWARDEANEEDIYTMVSPQALATVDPESLASMIERSRRAVFN
jgi:hypothetical protein